MRNKKMIAALSTLVLGTLLGFGSIVKGRLVWSESSQSVQLVNVQSQQGEPVRMIRFILFENGIYPTKKTVGKGLLNLTIEDKTHRSQGLAVDRIIDNAATKIGTVRPKSEQSRGRELMRLGPGTYRVYDTSQPQNSAELIVEP